jgi:hypothetical protein
MTDRITLLVRLLAETDGLIAEIESGLDEMPPTDSERMRGVDAEMKMIRNQIERALKKLETP